MADGELGTVLNHIRASLRDVSPADAELLERFAAAGDAAAFELLVWRHASLVHGVCRRVLGDRDDAEDAFQAAFLVLARKAPSIRKGAALAGWLYKVAYRVAATARARRAGRVRRERPLFAAADVAAAPAGVPPSEQAELRAVLDDELSRLPEALRLPAILCYVEGKTVDEAAAQLGCPRGTVASRLARARQRLRGRLTRRGLAGVAAAVAADVCHTTTAAPPALVQTAVRAALQSTNGAAPAGTVPGSAAALAEEVLKAMWFTKLKAVAVALVMLVGVLVAGGGLAVGLFADAPPQPQPVPAAAPVAQGEGVPAQPKDKEKPPVRVTVRRPVQRELTPFQEFVGRLEAFRTVDVRPNVSGRLVNVVVKEGTEVKKGDLLFELDPTAFRAAAAQAEAQLALAEAKRQAAKRELDRASELFQTGAVPEAVVAEKRATMQAAAAGVSVARAALERAQHDLNATRVLAPAQGLFGRALVDPGNLVTADGGRGTPLTTITQVHPIVARFEMDERSFLHYRRLIQDGQLKGAGEPLSMTLADGSDYPGRGQLESFADRIDPKTGTVTARGLFANPKRLLLPGMFVRVRLAVGKPRHVLAIPEAARLRDKGKDYVLVVDDRNQVERRLVQLGELDELSEGDLRAIESGLRPGDWVVVEGQTRVRAGQRVDPHREKAP
jgi:RND family efflux transporter MFP subunit